MIHPIYRITDCKLLPPYSLLLKFNDGATRTVDLESVLEGRIYGPLRDITLFSKVELDREVGTVVWPNGADFDPSILHDWVAHKDSFTAAAKRWKESAHTHC